MTKPGYGYVITFSPRGEDQGEFWREEVYSTELRARREAFDCMGALGVVSEFIMIDRSALFPHVVSSWDNKVLTVWLEKLEIVL